MFDEVESRWMFDALYANDVCLCVDGTPNEVYTGAHGVCSQELGKSKDRERTQVSL